MLPAQPLVWLGFLEAFRTFWVSPQPELRVLIDKVEVLDSVFG